MARKRAANTSQQHGNEIQYLLMGARMFTGVFNIARNGRESFDVEGRCDWRHGLATSIKTAGGDWIGLADAARFCAIDLPWRLLYAPWEQETPEVKRVDVVHEVIVTLGTMRRATGGLTPERVLAWHEDIASFAAGEEGATAARARAEEIRTEAEGECGILRLDFKIDRFGQRRLQLSLNFPELLQLLRGQDDYGRHGVRQPVHTEHRGSFHQIILPHKLLSSGRVIDRSLEERRDDRQSPLFELDEPTVPETPQLFAEAVPPSMLRRPKPVRMEERARRRAVQADTRQTALL